MYIVEQKKIRQFVTEEGIIPFQKWLKSLSDQRTIGKIEGRIARLRAGNFGDYKSVGNGVYELRIDYGPGYRIYFGQKGATLILLNGGNKNTQYNDIKTAQHYWLKGK